MDLGDHDRRVGVGRLYSQLRSGRSQLVISEEGRPVEVTEELCVKLLWRRRVFVHHGTRMIREASAASSEGDGEAGGGLLGEEGRDGEEDQESGPSAVAAGSPSAVLELRSLLQACTMHRLP